MAITSSLKKKNILYYRWLSLSNQKFLHCIINPLAFQMQADAVLKGRVDAFKPEDFVDDVSTIKITAI